MENDRNSFEFQQFSLASNGTERPVVNPQEIEIDGEKYGVLANLLEATDESRDLGTHLVSEFLNDRRIVITGEPSTGKSTILFQIVSCAEENARRLGIPFNKSASQYDFILESERRRRSFTQEAGKLEGDEFNERIFEAAMNADIFEVPGIGRTDEVDRGRSAVELMEEYMSRGIDDRTVILSLYHSPVVQYYGTLLRTSISSARTRDVFRLLSQYGMDIEGVPKTMQVARYIKDVFLLMASAYHIEKIREEVRNEVQNWEEKQEQIAAFGLGDSTVLIPENESKSLNLVRVTPQGFFDVAQKFGIDDFESTVEYFEKKAENANGQIDSQARYMNWRYRELLGLNSDRAIIAGNSYTSHGTSINLSPLISRNNT